ncbi:MAG: DUF1294 domain-containing protein [Paludibacter sp.]|nr:DUF1294 domain-containing protein [Bacteroidales bacterium]MCM1069898.1 DUF1294 domain-containing protein [Prevotella sp.]MCM1354579.1 DUF1294 domain-containing protein [Bacteroides sp.]MCM1443474.1 DUF1294 domain-containing protein [Muribaculum sp.]MCM1482558.1 DUF1294 domain-containing protein [Paludibacter sp.]
MRLLTNEVSTFFYNRLFLLIRLDVIVCLWLVLINLLTFVLYGCDKRRARRGDWRIPESTLLMFTALGGSGGAMVGMHVFRHKTRHCKFKLLVPLLLLLHATSLFLYCLYRIEST